MRNFSPKSWGKAVYGLCTNSGTNHQLYTQVSLSFSRHVGKRLIYTSRTQILYHRLSTIKTAIFTTVRQIFIPTIHTTNKRNNNINLLNYLIV